MGCGLTNRHTSLYPKYDRARINASELAVSNLHQNNNNKKGIEQKRNWKDYPQEFRAVAELSRVLDSADVAPW